MKDPKDFTKINDIPDVFKEALIERIGDIEDINELSREDVVKEQIGWTLGDPYWYNTIEEWLNAAGLKIVDDE